MRNHETPLDGIERVNGVSSSNPNRIDWLDGLRGCAILAVVLVHSGQIIHSLSGFGLWLTSAGQYGVQLFFVVSALTIGLTYDAHVARYGPGVRSDLSWLIKRFFRIAPLYYFAIVFYGVEQYVVYRISHGEYGHKVNYGNVAINFLFLHTWVPSANNSVVPGGWSIGAEIAFYLLVPAIWKVTEQRLRMILLTSAIAPALLLTILASHIVNGSVHVSKNSFFYFWFPTQLPVFALGLIYYFLIVARSKQDMQVGLAPLALFLSMALFFLGVKTGSSDISAFFAPLLVGAAFICQIVSLRGAVRRVFVNRLTTFFGSISYSIYIFHFVVLDCLKAGLKESHVNLSASMLAPLYLFVLLVTSVFAAWSRRGIENPGIAFGHRAADRVIRGIEPRVPARSTKELSAKEA